MSTHLSETPELQPHHKPDSEPYRLGLVAALLDGVIDKFRYKCLEVTRHKEQAYILVYQKRLVDTIHLRGWDVRNLKDFLDQLAEKCRNEHDQ